jgi:hypothetical protein
VPKSWTSDRKRCRAARIPAAHLRRQGRPRPRHDQAAPDTSTHAQQHRHRFPMRDGTAKGFGLGEHVNGGRRCPGRRVRARRRSIARR